MAAQEGPGGVDGVAPLRLVQIGGVEDRSAGRRRLRDPLRDVRRRGLGGLVADGEDAAEAVVGLVGELFLRQRGPRLPGPRELRQHEYRQGE